MRTVATSSIIYRIDHCKEHRPKGSNIQTRNLTREALRLKIKNLLTGIQWLFLGEYILYPDSQLCVFMAVTLTDLLSPASPEIGTSLYTGVTYSS